MRTSECKEHFNLCSINRKMLVRKNLRESKHKEKVGHTWCISFSAPIFSDCGLASGQTYIPGVAVSCLVPAWVPSRVRALGSAWEVMHTKNSIDVAITHHEWQSLWGTSSSPSCFICPFHTTKTLPAQKRGKQPRKTTKSPLIRLFASSELMCYENKSC